jgi:hypothetical protein
MVKYILTIMVVISFALLVAGMAAAECSKDCNKKAEQSAGEASVSSGSGGGCQNPKCEHKPCKEAATDTEVQVRGMVKAIDLDKGEVVFCPDGTTDEVLIKAGNAGFDGIKAGDRIRIAYERGEPNIAVKVARQRKIENLPKPCTNKRSGEKAE